MAGLPVVAGLGWRKRPQQCRATLRALGAAVAAARPHGA